LVEVSVEVWEATVFVCSDVDAVVRDKVSVFQQRESRLYVPARLSTMLPPNTSP
jgi:hypothetical protein